MASIPRSRPSQSLNRLLRTSRPRQCHRLRPHHNQIQQLSCQRPYTTSPRLLNPSQSHLPRILQPSLWATIIPKSLRRTPKPDTDAPAPSSAQQSPPPSTAATAATATTATTATSYVHSFTHHPAFPILVLGILIGSMAIHTLTLKNEMLAYSRQAEAKIGLLQEVIRKVQESDEDWVDVEGLLGAGRREVEGEWEDVLREIEEDDVILKEYEKRKMKTEAKGQAREQHTADT